MLGFRVIVFKMRVKAGDDQPHTCLCVAKDLVWLCALEGQYEGTSTCISDSCQARTCK